jgi:outer membrane protein assembly factor BamA
MNLLYNSRVSCRAICLLFFIFLFIPAPAQKSSKPALSYKLLSIHIKGASQLNDDELIAASGLKLGQYAGESDFQQATKKLGDTGLFTNLAYSYHYSSAGCDVEFQIAENTELVPILFDNLVWFSDADLIAQLHSRLPLFKGRLPRGGDLADQVSDSLNSILAEHKIAGKADYLRASSGVNGPISSYIYKITLHPIVIRNLSFPGADAAEVLALQAAGKLLGGHEYLRSDTRPHEQLDFLPVYLSRGYLKAAFADAQAQIVDDGPRTVVDVSFPITPGKQYKLTGMQWQGNVVFPADKLQELIHLKNNQPADAVQLNDDIEAIQKLYGTKGYLMARVNPTPAMDDTQATVAYALSVNEGDQFRMGELEVDGLDPDATKKLAAQWQLKKGDPYDKSYLPKFFSVTYRDVGLRRPYNVVPRENVNQQDKTVSVALHFVPKG